MARQFVLRSSDSTVGRRQPLLGTSEYPTLRRRRSAAELAGGTTADCAAVCCCGPCAVVNLVVLAVYRVPAGLCRKAIKRNRLRRLMKKGGIPPRRCGCDEEFFELHPISSHVSMVSAMDSLPEDIQVVELEKEMWDKFYGAGFWRSPSQRTEISACSL